MRIRELKALRIAADDVLIVHLPNDVPDGFAEEVRKALDVVGLKERALVFVGDAQFVAAKRDAT